MKLPIAAAAVVAAVALPAAPAAAQDGTGVTLKVRLSATIEARDDGSFGGAVVGRPFGKGVAVYAVRGDGDRQVARFTARFARGTIRGTARVTATPAGGPGELSYRGTLDVARGTRAFRGIEARALRVTGSASGGVVELRIRGAARFPVTTR